MDKELEERIKLHQDNVKQLFILSPKTEIYQAKITRFFLTHPGIIGISYSAAEVLLKEKNVAVQREAIDCVSAELKQRGDVNAPNFCFVRRGISENQVRKIVLNIKKKNTPQADVKDNNLSRDTTRSKVVSFRATECEQDAIDYLASKCNVRKSFLVDVLIEISNRYSINLKQNQKKDNFRYSN